jgi:hypothetical protein
MYDAGKIVPGLAAFLAVATFPIWYNLARGSQVRAPEIEKPAGATRCVEDVATMRHDHMRLLQQWREQVVRQDDRVFVTADGRHFNKSLTGTCLGCHKSKEASCDRCHNYLGVHPYCWDCHVDPKGGQ